MIKLQEKDTLQETFDFVVGKLREQGKPAMDDNGTQCVYGKPGAERCAIGHLMPVGSNYRQNIAVLMKENLVERSDNVEFLSDIQLCHDRSAGLLSWKSDCARALVDIARFYGLNPDSAEKWLAQ